MAGWNGWASLGGPVIGGRPVGGRNVDGRLEVFGHAQGGAGLEIVHAWQTAPGGGWSGWDSLGAPPTGNLGDLALGENGDGRLAVFVVVLGGSLWRRQQAADPAVGWDGWEDLGMPSGVPLTGVSVGRNADGRLEVFSVSHDLNVWHRWETAPGGAWSGWSSLGTPAAALLLDRPVVGTNADGRLELFTVSRDGAGSEAWHIWQDGATPTGWSAWESLGGSPGGLDVAQNADGRLEVFATLGDGSPTSPTGVLHRWQTTPNGGWSVDQTWIPTLTGSVRRLAQTTDGTTFAWGAAGLFRSEDAGLTWTTLPTPPTPRLIAIDPSDAHTLFAASGSHVHKTTDDGATWTPVLATGGLQVLAIAVSPADPDLVFVALAQFSASFQVHRSLDGGATWTRIEGPLLGATCIFSVPVLVPHPTDPARLLRSSGCYAGRDVPSGDSLDQSLDQGVTWSPLFHPRPLFPDRLIGGMGSAPSRWYLSAHFGASPGGGKLFRSDDDGATWADVLAFASGPAVVGVTHDPGAPGHVVAALTTGVVTRSVDAGASWTDLASGPTQIADVLLMPGGLALLAATNQGVWRLDL